MFFTLRNFKLHQDQALHANGTDVGQTEAYVRQMARALAVCHWVAGVDANDVEFVIGGAPSAVHLIDRPGHDQSRRPAVGTRLWMYDFDESNDITKWTSEGMRKVALAAETNDPYFPKPCSANPAEQRLWSVFEEQYLQASLHVLGCESERAHLPPLFVSE